MTTTQTLPRWLLILSGVFALMELMVSISIWVAPESVLEMVDMSVKGVDYVVYMWTTRQFALGVIFAFATIKKSVPMLTLSYLFFLVMFAGDLFIGIIQKDISLISSASIMCIVSAAMLLVLNKHKA